MKRKYFLFICSLLCLNVSAELKYIFFFIGDGMGLNHILLTEKYLSRMQGEDGRLPLCMSKFPYSGIVTTHAKYSDITDSSAAGTCLATGKKTSNGKLGIDEKNNELKTISDSLHSIGWNIGIGTSVSLDNATPAAFYAHQKSRKAYYNIGQQLATSGFEFFGGAPFLQPYPTQEKEKEKSLYNLCTNNQYTFAHGYTDALTKLNKKKLILLPLFFNPNDSNENTMEKLPYAIDKEKKELTLNQITEIAIRKLSDKNFFLMIEGGAIDWAAHANDGKAVIGEVIEFDAAIKTAYRFYQSHKDETLIIVSADHETGGLALGIDNKYFLHLAYLQYQICSSEKISRLIKDCIDQNEKKISWTKIKSVLMQNLGLFTYIPVTNDEEKELMQSFEKLRKSISSKTDASYSNADKLTADAIALVNKKAYIGWTTTGHSGTFVPIFAIGVGADAFSGIMDNSDIIPKIYKILRSQKTTDRPKK